jgi:hypothetical protein
MKFLQNGYEFTDELDILTSVNGYCRDRNVKARVFLVSKEDDKRYVIFDHAGNPVYEDTTLEGIGVHIDIMALNEQIK